MPVEVDGVLDEAELGAGLAEGEEPESLEELEAATEDEDPERLSVR